jgi:GTP-binding protein
VLLHLIDAYSDDVAKAYKTIRNELEVYNKTLIDRPEIVALTKIEGLDEELIQMQIDAVKAVAGDSPVFAISSPAHKGITEVLRALRTAVDEVRAQDEPETDADTDGLPVITLSSDQVALSWKIKKTEENGQTVYVVTGHKIEKFARRTNFDTHEGLNRLRDIMKKMGITHALHREGAEGDSLIRIEGNLFPLVEQ